LQLLQQLSNLVAGSFKEFWLEAIHAAVAVKPGILPVRLFVNRASESQADKYPFERN